MVQAESARTLGLISNSILTVITFWVSVPPNTEMTPISQDTRDNDQTRQDLEHSTMEIFDSFWWIWNPNNVFSAMLNLKI